MYPFFEPISGIVIYSFGLTLTIIFFLFIWMLKKLCMRLGSDYTFFSKNIIWYFLSVFIFSRLFYVISRWEDMKYINNPFEFLIMSDYNFSLAGAIFGFGLVFFINLRLENKSIEKQIDPLVLSFLFVLFIGYIGALFGGQVYGNRTDIGIELLYLNKNSPVPFQVPIFPLPIIYSILFFILFSGLYMLSMFVNIKGFIGYVGMIVFGSIILIFEFFSGKEDTFKNLIGVNLIQLFSLFIIGYMAYNMYKLMNNPKNIDKSIIKH